MALRKFISANSFDNVFDTYNIKEGTATLKTDELNRFDENSLIFVDDSTNGNWIYAKGHLYGGGDFTEDVSKIKSDINDIGKFVFDQYEKISKNTDNINVLNLKLDNIVDSHENKLKIIENSLDIANNFSRLSFDVSVYSSPEVDNVINEYPTFLDEYAVFILKNNLSYDVSTMLTFACLTLVTCHDANTPQETDIVVIPGTLISYIAPGHIKIINQSILIEVASIFIILQLTTSLGIFCRIMDLKVFKTYKFFAWQYYPFLVSKDKIISDTYSKL